VTRFILLTPTTVRVFGCLDDGRVYAVRFDP
jgi:hypothetical protein